MTDMAVINEPMKSVKLSSEAWVSIKPILTRLFRLHPPARLPVRFELPSHTNRVRDWLYIYFREMNLKSLYRIKRESPKSLTILTLQPLVPIFDTTDIFSSIEDFVRTHLLTIDTEAEVKDIIQAELSTGRLTDTAFLAILAEWRRVMGVVEPPNGQGGQATNLSALDLMPSPSDLWGQAPGQEPKGKDESIKRNDTGGNPPPFREKRKEIKDGKSN